MRQGVTSFAQRELREATLPASASRAQPNVVSRARSAKAKRSCCAVITPGKSIIATNARNIPPASKLDQNTRRSKIRLSAVAINPKPTRKTQNNGDGMYSGTIAIRPFAAARCSAPKVASGAATNTRPSAIARGQRSGLQACPLRNHSGHEHQQACRAHRNHSPRKLKH